MMSLWRQSYRLCTWNAFDRLKMGALVQSLPAQLAVQRSFILICVLLTFVSVSVSVHVVAAVVSHHHTPIPQCTMLKYCIQFHAFDCVWQSFWSWNKVCMSILLTGHCALWLSLTQPHYSTPIRLVPEFSFGFYLFSILRTSLSYNCHCGPRYCVRISLECFRQQSCLSGVASIRNRWFVL